MSVGGRVIGEDAARGRELLCSEESVGAWVYGAGAVDTGCNGRGGSLDSEVTGDWSRSVFFFWRKEGGEGS
jgi:hypothetical protein